MKAKDEGLRLVEQEAYLVNGQQRHAGVWIENREDLGWASYRNLTSAEFSQRFNEQKDAGRMPVDVDAYQTSGGMRYSIVWVDNDEDLAWALWRDMSSADFSTKFASYQDDYRLLAFDSVQAPGGQKYAGIWVENANGRAWRVRRDLTAQGFANWWHRYRDEGYRLVSYDRYQTAGGPRYAGIWRQDNDRPEWALKDEVNALVEAEVADHDVPGMSVAVMQDGKFRYLRGFGHASIDDGVWLDSNHVGRLASVSKAVAGVLTMRLDEQGEIDLDDKTRDHVAEMPAHHTHTLEQLASSRGCVRHYPQGDDSFADQEYETALEAAEQFWDDPLVCTPGEYFYTTHGLTLLASAYEAATGDTVSELVVDRLTEPFALGTLRPEDRDDTSVRRMTLYDSSNNEADPDHISWKTLGGGLEASVQDLARFGGKLAAGEILEADSLETMWTPPNNESSYALGWSTGEEDGHQVVAKNGAQLGARSYLRIYPDDGIVIAVLSNRKGGGHSATQLGQDIGKLMLDEL